MSFSLSSMIRRRGVVRGNKYTNEYIGLSFFKPLDWYFLSETELAALPDSQKYSLDDDFVDELFEEIGLPLVNLASSRDNEIVPQADVWVQTPEDSNVGIDVVGEQYETFAMLYGSLLRELEFEVFPSESTFCECIASVCTTRFIYEDSSGLSVPVRVKSILMPVEELLVSINLKAAAELWTLEIDSTFETFLGSFSLSARRK